MRTLAFGLAVIALLVAAPAVLAQQPGRGFGGGGGMLLSQESVQKELKLSEEQIKKIDEFLAKQRESFSGLRDLSREERQARFNESREASRKAIDEILDDAQQARYEQISLQLQGPQALSNPEVAGKLGLSDEQKKKVEEIQSASREETRGLFQRGGDGDRAEAMKKLQAARQATAEKLNAVLTPEQQAKWKELTGEPFKGELRGPSRGGDGQRRRRNRDNASLAPTTVEVLTADKSESSEGKKQAAKDEVKKEKKDGAKARHARHDKGDHRKHAHHKHGQRGHDGKHARHRGHGHDRGSSHAWHHAARGKDRSAHREDRDHARRSFSPGGRSDRGRPEFARHGHRGHHHFTGGPRFAYGHRGWPGHGRPSFAGHRGHFAGHHGSHNAFWASFRGRAEQAGRCPCCGHERGHERTFVSHGRPSRPSWHPAAERSGDEHRSIHARHHHWSRMHMAAFKKHHEKKDGDREKDGGEKKGKKPQRDKHGDADKSKGEKADKEPARGDRERDDD